MGSPTAWLRPVIILFVISMLLMVSAAAGFIAGAVYGNYQAYSVRFRKDREVVSEAMVKTGLEDGLEIVRSSKGYVVLVGSLERRELADLERDLEKTLGRVYASEAVYGIEVIEDRSPKRQAVTRTTKDGPVAARGPDAGAAQGR